MIRRLAVLSGIVAALLLANLANVAAALAHPAPSVIHDYIISMADRTLLVRSYLRISPELVPEVYRQIDADADGATSAAEAASWVAAHPGKLSLTLDGAPLALHLGPAPALAQADLLASISTPLELTYSATLAAPATGKHRIKLSYGDNYLSYDEYYISVAGDLLNDGKPHSVARNQYPATYQIVYQVPASAEAKVPPGQLADAPWTMQLPAPAAPARAAPQQASGDDILSRLRGWNGDLWSGLGLLLLATGLGALHALSPGHGKAMVAAYLLGSRGRSRDAVALGGVVTITHTAGVLALGLALLLLSSFTMPRALQPALELVSGALVLALGSYLLLRRWREANAGRMLRDLVARLFAARRTSVATAGPTAAAVFVRRAGERNNTLAASSAYHTHDGQGYHRHDGTGHSHPPARGGGGRELLALGISGGLVPCPDALAILLLAASVGQFGLGLGLVAAFSLGLAAVLIGLGLTLVRLKSRLVAPTNPLLTRWAPLFSALVVLLIGLLMIAAALNAPWS